MVVYRISYRSKDIYIYYMSFLVSTATTGVELDNEKRGVCVGVCVCVKVRDGSKSHTHVVLIKKKTGELARIFLSTFGKQKKNKNKMTLSCIILISEAFIHMI